MPFTQTRMYRAIAIRLKRNSIEILNLKSPKAGKERPMAPLSDQNQHHPQAAVPLRHLGTRQLSLRLPKDALWTRLMSQPSLPPYYASHLHCGVAFTLWMDLRRSTGTGFLASSTYMATSRPAGSASMACCCFSVAPFMPRHLHLPVISSLLTRRN